MNPSTFASAARAFTRQVTLLGDADWNGPGLGDWDLRALVGHASRSLSTVSTYLQSPADREDVAGPAEYYVLVHELLATADTADVVERGRQAGRDLGGDPAAAITRLADRALADVTAAADPLITVIGGLGIRLSNYLPTRVFELTVHGLDIARASGVPFTPPPEALTAATALAAEVSVALGWGTPVLLALTGRSALPDGFSAV